MKEVITILLSLLMLCMGLNLKISDFQNVLKSPKILVLGLILQYALMPFLACIISIALSLKTELIIGMILVGATSGGLASNVVCYLAKANLGLSVTLTAISTFLSAFLTPLIIKFLLNEVIAVSTYDMSHTLLKIVITPILIGMITNIFFPKKMLVIKRAMPAIAKILILTIIALITIMSKKHLNQINLTLISAIILHNALGLILGYQITSIFTKNVSYRRTIAIEVAMQNSGLALILAIKHFSILSSIPAVIFSIWHNISGFILANFWSKKPIKM